MNREHEIDASVTPDINAMLADYDKMHEVETIKNAAFLAMRDDGQVVSDPVAAKARAQIKLANWIAILSRFKRDTDPGFDASAAPSLNFIPTSNLSADSSDPNARQKYEEAKKKHFEDTAKYNKNIQFSDTHDVVLRLAVESIVDAHENLNLSSAYVKSKLNESEIMNSDRDTILAALH